MAISPFDSSILYAAVETDRRNGAVYKTTDSGGSWKKMSDTVSGATGPHYYQELVASPHVFDKIYLMDTKVQVSENGGKDFYIMNESDNGIILFNILSLLILLGVSVSIPAKEIIQLVITTWLTI